MMCRMYWTITLKDKQYQHLVDGYGKGRTQIIYIWHLFTKTIRRFCGDDGPKMLCESISIANLTGHAIGEGGRQHRISFNAPLPIARILLRQVPNVKRRKKCKRRKVKHGRRRHEGH